LNALVIWIDRTSREAQFCFAILSNLSSDAYIVYLDNDCAVKLLIGVFQHRQFTKVSRHRSEWKTWPAPKIVMTE
jgi:hypothetical protein